MKRLTIFGILIVCAAGAFPATLMAQLDNKPFSFKGTPDGGVGMSIGGQQAIINKKVLGASPDNLVRGANGILLDVVEGPGKSAIVSFQGGETIPKFRGTSWKGDNSNISVGAFNSYFSPSSGGSSVRSVVFLNSSATVSTWTARVTSGGFPASYSPGSPVDMWTGMTYQN